MWLWRRSFHARDALAGMCMALHARFAGMYFWSPRGVGRFRVDGYAW